MDILLSLPLLSYFLSPGMTSWSTSLNLLFFYMTWTTLVFSHSPLRIELIGLLAIRLVLHLLPSLLSLLVDTLIPSLAGGIKINGASSLPPRNASQLGRTLGLVLMNLALETGVQAGISISYSLLRPENGPLLQTSTTLPLPWAIMKHIALLLGAREVLTYVVHRYFLHSRENGGRIAKWHVTNGAHARRGAAPFSLLLCADHPVPFLLHRFAPLYLPALVLRPHLITFLAFAALATAEETLSMSGYSVVPGIVMGGIVRRTAVHCCCSGGAARTEGNFGAWGLLDWACGTSLGRDVMDDVRDETAQHRVKERGEKAAGDGIGIIQNGIEGLRRSQRVRKSRRLD